jgi:hypothetical protein
MRCACLPRLPDIDLLAHPKATKEDEVVKMRSAGVAAWIALTLLLAGCGGTVARTTVGSSAAERVDVFSLVPSYHGQKSTWDSIHVLQAHGRAKVVWVFASDAGNFALAFDDDAEKAAWICSREARAYRVSQLCVTHQPTH